MLRFKFHQNCSINEEFYFWGVKGVVWGVWGLQKLGQLENMFPYIIRGCFCKKKEPLYAICSR